MESKEEMESKINDATAKSTVPTPLYVSPRIPKPEVLMKHMVQRFRAKEYKQLEEDLLLYKLSGLKINHFLEKIGPSLIHWAVCLSPDPGPLTFLCQRIISRDILTELLRSDNYYVLRRLAFKQKEPKEWDSYNQERERVQIAKLKLLLEVSSPAVDEFMKNPAFKDSIAPEFRANVVAALPIVALTLKSPVSAP